MRDTPPPDMSPLKVHHTERVCGPPEKGRGSSVLSQTRKVNIKFSGEDLLMDFESDSDDGNGGGDGGGDVEARRASGSRQGQAVLTSSLKELIPSSSGLKGIFSDSEDDFCIVNTPTSTSVVSVCVMVNTYLCGVMCVWMLSL